MALTKVQTGSIQDSAVTEAKIDTTYTSSVKTNPEFQGTEAARMPSGTTAQRGTAKSGDIRFNETISLMEYYDGTQWKAIDSPPTITSISPTEVASEGGGTVNIVITGSNFASGATVKAIGSDASEISAGTVAVDSVSQITATFTESDFSNANEPYDIKVTNTSGLSATLADNLNVDNSPSWVTAAGSLGTIQESATGTHATVVATDPESTAVTYSETTSILSGAGLSLDTSNGTISGDPTDVNTSTTYTFTLRATSGGKTADREFSIGVNPDDEISGTGNTITTYNDGSNDYKLFVFKNSGTMTTYATRSMDILVIGGGGAGGGGAGSNYGAGAGAGGVLWRTGKSLPSQTFDITVGAGGTWTNSQVDGVKGSNSQFANAGATYTLTGLGGGGGSGKSNVAQNYTIMNGGSGGGAGRDAGNQAAGTAQQGNSEDASATAYGNNGGTAGGTGCTSGGGGGGAGEAGHNGGYDCETARSGTQSEGGDGIASATSMSTSQWAAMLWAAQVGTNASHSANSAAVSGGTPVTSLGSNPGTIYIAGGGGGGYEGNNASDMPYGGLGGGGRGGGRYPNATGQPGYSGVVNTGSGGGGNQTYGGGSGQSGGSGGKGVVIVRYQI